MATKTILIDDTDGGPADVTIAFVIDGNSYSIDLSNENAKKFHQALEPYVKVAKSHSKLSSIQGEIAAVQQRVTIRAWAKKNGLDVSDRGRIPQEIVDAYHQRGKKK